MIQSVRLRTSQLIVASFCAIQPLDARAEMSWHVSEDGPGSLGDVAAIEVPAGYLFAPKSQMPELNRLTGNLDGPGDVGALLPGREDAWIAFFVWRDIGYVNDEEKDSLDADAMLESFQEMDERANEQRTARGYSTLETVGWEVPPYYDPQTNNLTWALKLRSGSGEDIVNHNIRILGRRGVMEVILVSAPSEIAAAIDEFTPLLAGFSFSEGQSYAEYVQGDRLAQVGLTGLIVGGGAVLAAKSGLLGILAKNLKLVVLGAAGLVAALGSRIKSLFRGRGAPPA